MMCHEFIGKKMYSTGALRNFAANNYRTSEEMHRSLNTIIAVAALLISVLSFSYIILNYTNTKFQFRQPAARFIQIITPNTTKTPPTIFKKAFSLPSNLIPAIGIKKTKSRIITTAFNVLSSYFLYLLLDIALSPQSWSVWL